MCTSRAAAPTGIDLAYETFGKASDPPVVLVMGLGVQMLGWPDDFCRELMRRGHFVVRFDNRDVGLSTHLDGAEAGAYTLSDMAGDTVALLASLGIDAVHLVGASMGGMIAQTVAIEHPTRVRSLTSIMSSTGDPSVGQATEAATGALLAPPATSLDSYIERTVRTYRVIGSPGFHFDEAALRQRARRSYERGYDAPGIARQLAAIYASGDRTAQLTELGVPTLVIHGADDQLVGVSGGRATAAAIPDAELVVIDGMGHDLPRELWPSITDRIAGLVARAESAY